MRLELDGIEKRYGNVEALRGLDLQADSGEIVALLGPSGAGKSTTLRVASGIDRPTKGRVLLDGEDVTKVPPWKRGGAMVFESYVLYPHLTVFENVVLPLRRGRTVQRPSPAEERKRTEELARILEIEPLLDRRPAELSGGQRQRVAIARALIRDARVYLLDEPISHLDAKLRHWLRGELRRLLTASAAPTIWTTPDGLEAMAVADRVAVLVGGSLVQVGTPAEVYSRPATARVAELLGDPPMNVLYAEVNGAGPAFRLRDLDHPIPALAEGRALGVTGAVQVGVRPSALSIARAPGPTRTRARVIGRELGSRYTIVTTRLGNQIVRVKTNSYAEVSLGSDVWLDWSGARIYLFQGGSAELQSEVRVAPQGPAADRRRKVKED